ncbi:DMT family transporter [Desulfomarina sp.]
MARAYFSGQLMTRQSLLGWVAVFCSAFCFYLATAIIRWAEPKTDIATSYFVFARFLLGFLVVSGSMLIRKESFRPRKYHYLIGRTLTNTISVFCFYKAIDFGSVAEANILNMTYPLFVALFSWFFLKNQRDLFALLIVGVAFTGVWMILAPGEPTTVGYNYWGLSSGIMAAGAMIYLNISRKYHDSQTILLFMFGFGSLGMFLLFHNAIFLPTPLEFYYLFTCSAAGVLGQYLLTYGFRYVTAVEGSIISSTRILLAALIGPVLVADPPLTMAGWCGALLIFSANIVLALRRSA